MGKPIRRILLSALFALAAHDVFAEESDAFRVWGGGGYVSSGVAGERLQGAKLIAGIRFPSIASERQSIRVSAARAFDGGNVDRYSLLAHVGYRLADPLEVALLAGVGYLERSGPLKGTYLKPLIGLEVVSLFYTRGAANVSAFAAYEVFQGSTGSVALDGGTRDLATKSLSIGLVLSFGLFHDSAAK